MMLLTVAVLYAMLGGQPAAPAAQTPPVTLRINDSSAGDSTLAALEPIPEDLSRRSNNRKSEQQVVEHHPTTAARSSASVPNAATGAAPAAGQGVVPLPGSDITTVPEKRPEGKVTIHCSPWAEVYIDGKKTDTTPLLHPLSLVPGTYRLELRNPNFSTHSRILQIVPGASDTLTIDLSPLAGYLQLTVVPWAAVYLDGEYIDTSPLNRRLDLPQGKHLLRLSNPAYHTWQDSIVIVAGRLLEKKVVLEKSQ